MWNKRFEAFVARKQAAAVEAKVPGYRTLEDRSSAFDLESIGNDWTDRLFGGPFFESKARDPQLPALNIVFVQSADGNTESDDPAELGGGETDKHLIYEGLSRVNADAVMAGANTVRGSSVVFAAWHPELVRLRGLLGLGRYPAQIVTTESGRIDMDSDLMFNVPEVRVFVLTTDGGARALRGRRPWVKVLSTGERSDLVGGLRRLRAEHGIGRISVVGGRTLTTALIDAGVVQDMYLTTSAISAGKPNTPYYTGSRALTKRRVLRKEGRAEEQGTVFEHLVLDL